MAQEKHIPYTSFDKGLWIAGGKETQPKGCARRYDAVDPIDTTTCRSRWGSTIVGGGIGSATMKTLYRFADHWIWNDSAGHLFKDSTQIATGLNNSILTFVKMPPQVGDVDYLFIAGGGNLIKIDQSANVTQWGITAPSTFPTLALGPQNILQINSFDTDAANWSVTAGGLTKANDNTNFQEGTGSLQITVPKNTRGSIVKTINIDLTAFASGSFVNNHAYNASAVAGEAFLGDRFVDSNNNVQVCTTSGTSQVGGTPTWSTIFGGTTVSGTATFTNFGPKVASTADIIKLWVGIDEPDNLELLEMDFLLTSAGGNYFTYQIPLSTQTFIPGSPSQGSGGGSAQQGVGSALALAAGPSAPGSVPAGATAPEVTFVTTGSIPGTGPVADPAVRRALWTAMHKKAPPPSSGPDTPSWFQLIVAKDEFDRQGSNFNLDWNNVVKVRFKFKSNTNGKVNVWLDGLQLAGGIGMEGNYQGVAVFVNTVTSSVSNPPLQVNQAYAQIKANERQAIEWSNLPISTDPQVNARALYRTLGNGALLFFVDLVNDNVTTTYQDTVADFVGAAGGNEPKVLGQTIIYSVQLEIDNLPPTSGWTKVAGPYEGSIFWCGDPAHPGRLYYSPTGRPEAQENFIDVTFEDDILQMPFVFNGSLYVLSLAHLFIVEYVQGTNPPLFTYDTVAGAPGTTQPFAVVVGKQRVCYPNAEGLISFDGYSAVPFGMMAINPLWRGEAAESYAAFVPTYGTYGKGEFWFTDGNQTFIINEQSQRWRSFGVGTGPIYYAPDLTFVSGLISGQSTVVQFEAVNSFTDNGTSIPFVIQPGGILLGEDVNAIVKRIVIDINTNGQTITPTLIVNDADLLSTRTINTPYAIGQFVIDSNGNVQVATVNGTTSPVGVITWNQNPNGTTNDGTQVWKLVGPGVFTLPTITTQARQRIEYELGFAAETLSVRLSGSLSTGRVELFDIIPVGEN